MSDVKWIKLSTNMFEDEKIRLIEQMPDADTILIIWVKLMAQAGKTNASGYIYLSENIPYTDEMLATIFNRPVSTVRLALKTFEQFGMLSIDEDHFININNWEKHQNIEGMERVKKLNAERNRKYRERKKQRQLQEDNTHDVIVTSHDGTELELEGELDKEKDIDLKENNSRKQVYDHDSVFYQLAQFFVEEIRSNNPNFKQPNMNKWSNDIRLMMERDNRTGRQIKYLMYWVQQDSFEMANVLSPAKLRKRFDNLVIKVKQEKKIKSPSTDNRETQYDNYDYGF